jgi:hypothetical protein
MAAPDCQVGGFQRYLFKTPEGFHQFLRFPRYSFKTGDPEDSEYSGEKEPHDSTSGE